jgi:NADPH-dependent 2,4-dienoyl-CoA reductase/sulfur reductase-like enzyme
MEIVIVGAGPAGLQAALECRRCWPEKSVTLIEREGTLGYCRPMLCSYMAGQVKEEKLYYLAPGEDPLLQVLTGVKVLSVERHTQTLHLENHEPIKYERLILAAGGRPIIPHVEGTDALKGVFPVRNFPEAKQVHDWLTKDQRIFVLGGGLVGVKTSVYLSAAGFHVSLVEKESRVLPLTLSAPVSRLVEDHLRQMGIELFLGQTLQAAGGENGIIKSVELGGKSVPCDTLLFAAGSVPNVGFLDGSGLLENGKLLVSTRLQTRDPKIFAAGDAVTIVTPEGKEITPWTWPQAISQGKLAAANLYRTPTSPLRILTRSNSTSLHGLPLVVLGAPVQGCEEISYAKNGEHIFREIFLQNGRLIGGALLGDISAAGPLHHRVISGKDSGSDAHDVIKPSYRAIKQSSVQGKRRRRARFMSLQEKQPC